MTVTRAILSSVVLVLVPLTGCKTVSTVNVSAVNAQEETRLPASPTAAVQSNESQLLNQNASQSTGQVNKPQRQLEDPAVKSLLAAAEQALLMDQLTTPEYDNAFDRFQAVLLLSPENPDAVLGLKQIQLRYVEMSRQALRASRFSQAENYLQRARTINSDNGLIVDVKNEIQQARQKYLSQRRREPLPAAPTFDGVEMTFDARALSRKEDSVVSQLQNFATTVRESGETMLIVARNDAEGRWIYRVMKEAVPGYRLRGDIKVGRVPKIRLLPAID